jgi:hypothetical protein
MSHGFERDSGSWRTSDLAGGLRGGFRGRCAHEARPEELQSMGRHLVSVALPYLIDQSSQLAVGYVLTPPAARANEVVVVFVGVAQHVCVRSVGQVEPLDDAK